MSTLETKIKRFSDFWPVYVLSHQSRANRFFHFLATLTSIVMGIVFAYTHKFVFLILMPVVSYAFAWAGHFIHEKNTPLTWTYPLYSLIADYKMFFLIISGKMQKEIVRVQSESLTRSSI